MPIILSCPSCNRKLKAKDEQVGKRLKCPACLAVITVSENNESEIAANEAEYSKNELKHLVEESPHCLYLKAQKLEMEKNYKDAVRVYEKAAQKDHRDSKIKLASFYYFGNGVDKDWEKAIFWYEKSECKHCRDFASGLYYYNSTGELRLKNIEKAVMYFSALAGKWHEDIKNEYPSEEKILLLEQTAIVFEELLFFNGELSDPSIDVLLKTGNEQKIRKLLGNMNIFIKMNDFFNRNQDIIRYNREISDLRIQALSRRFDMIFEMIGRTKVIFSGYLQRR